MPEPNTLAEAVTQGAHHAQGLKGYLAQWLSALGSGAGAVWFAVTRFATKAEVKAATSGLSLKAETDAKFDGLTARLDDFHRDMVGFVSQVKDDNRETREIVTTGFDRVHARIDEMKRG